MGFGEVGGKGERNLGCIWVISLGGWWSYWLVRREVEWGYDEEFYFG